MDPANSKLRIVGVCPLCLGNIRETHTQGRWQCDECKANLLIGHTSAQSWPHLEDNPNAGKND